MTDIEGVNQELRDHKGHREVPWKDKKLVTQLLADSYFRLNKENKALRVQECATYLEFRRFLEDGSLKLQHANFCKVRLCPMCAWRRSLKIFAQVSQVMDLVVNEDKTAFLFLTLTCRNVEGKDLSLQIDELFKAYELLVKRKAVKDISMGWFRALEVTHNLHTNTYHPHFHVVMGVDQKYFVNPDVYLSHEKWVNLWKQSMRVDYIPVVDVRRVKSASKSLEKTVAEVAKYTVKEGDFLIRDKDGQIQEEATDQTVQILDHALARRRLVAFGGPFRQIQRQLKLDDMEEGNLVLTDQEEIRSDLAYVIEKYSWHVGYKSYIKN